MLEQVTATLKVIFLGIVEGITEWLPISSTGHMLLVDEFLQLNASEAFKDMFFVVIQLGAILAVVLLFWKKMWPFQRRTASQGAVRWDTMQMWCKVVVACIPGAVVTILFDNYIEAHLHTPWVIAAALIVYFVKSSLYENLLTKLLGRLALADVFMNISSSNIVDVSGLLLYVSILIIFVFLTIQTIQKRRWS